MPSPIVGLHHVSAIASDPQQTLDFYTGIVGLRFVKRTVNFDDPSSYHLYFGDDGGSPGTILTFFAWPGALRGHAGVGEVSHVSFSVPLASIDFWEQHLLDNGVLVERSGRRLRHEVLTLPDPDGTKIEIVGHADAGPVNAPRFSSIPPEHAIRGFLGVTLLEQRAGATAAILKIMGYHQVAEENGRIRFSLAGAPHGSHIDLLIDANAHYGNQGAGSVHHIAFRAKDDASQLEWRAEIARHLKVTPVLDRTYFHSIYFREPGGVLFEIATDPPGFSFDEPPESLGEELKLPAWLEWRRSEVEKRLPQIELHKPLPPPRIADRNRRINLTSDPHRNQPMLRLGAPLKEASGVMILLHGRGGSAGEMLSLGGDLGGPGFAYLAPQAADNTWYPCSFLAPLEQNEPYLSSALDRVESTVELAVAAGISVGKIVIAGFSQGACLATEFVARYPRAYGGLIAFTGGLIGPPDSDLTHSGNLESTSAFLGSGDPDPHVPWHRVQQSGEVLKRMGADVAIHRYPGMPHTITPDEIESARQHVRALSLQKSG